MDQIKIRSLPDEKLMIRAGVHTGPASAAVVGIKMPRYTIIGDTVNTASRMESNSERGRVHISNSTYDVLDLSNFDITSRGELDIKGKGKMSTYFVDKCHDSRSVKLLQQ